MSFLVGFGSAFQRGMVRGRQGLSIIPLGRIRATPNRRCTPPNVIPAKAGIQFPFGGWPPFFWKATMDEQLKDPVVAAS